MKRRSMVPLILATSMIATGLAAQDRGAVTGQVVNATTQAPLAGVQVVVAGTALGTVTNQQGRFLVANVPTGQREVRASVIGYSRGTLTVNVGAGQTVNADFSLEPSVVLLEGVVATATGQDQRRREIGSAVANISVSEVDLAPVTSMSQLMQARVPGVVVTQSSGTTGGGSRIRIRGNNSLSLSNAPLLVIDGVRVYSAEGSLGFGVGGQSPSRLDDLNPEDIASIEILRGPSAAALYGTAAANGVIQVTTKRGQTGAGRFDVWSEYGEIDRNYRFPDNFTRLDAFLPQFRCPIVYENSGICVPQAQTYRANPLEDAESTPFGTGNRRVGGASVSGGSDVATFYLSGEYETEDGIYLTQNTLERARFQANVSGNVGPALSVAANLAYMDSDLELPLSDNALFGIVGMGVFGDADPASVLDTKGYENDPAFHEDWKTFQDLSRLTASFNSSYRPLPWLGLNGTAGIDRIARTEVNRLPRDNAHSVLGGVRTNGFIQNYGYDIAQYTASGSASGTFAPTATIETTTTVGFQYNREILNRVYAFGAGLSPGSETSLAGATSDFAADEVNVSDALFGASLQQQAGWRDRLFLNVSVRGDRSSAFGTDYGWAWFPALSTSWVVSEEEFIPDLPFLDEFRLRAAWGQSGLRPGTTDALLFFSPAITTVASRDVPAFAISGMGNSRLEPERSSEYEVGFDAALFERVGLTLTWFNKTSTDALVSVPVAPSAGGTSTRWENLARVRNSGLEFTLDGLAFATDDIRTNFFVGGSLLDNELVELGNDGSGEPLDPIIFGEQRHVEGYPLGGYWQRPILDWDVVNGGVGFGDVDVGADPQYMGSPFASRQVNFGLNATFFNLVRVSTLFDHRGGHKLLNYSRAWRETFEENDARSYEATPEEQAGQVALLESERRTYAAYIEDASFVKWRELALTVSVPQNLTRRVGADGMSVTLAGRNLATWTGYSGIDPEVNFSGQSNFTTADFATLPANRQLTIRIDANF